MTLTILEKLPSLRPVAQAARIPVAVAGSPGWLHSASGRVGVVLCAALDYEALCTGRALFQLAENLADSGIATLRFDYPGHLESAAGDPGANFIASCVEATRAAIDLLKAKSGVAEVLLVGLRFGALIAPLAAQGRKDIAGLALLAQPASGRAFLRALTVQARLLAEGRAPGGEGEIEIAGFRLSSDSQAAIKAVAAPTLPAVPRVLILDPAGEGEAKPADAGVERGDFPGYGQMMQNPTLAEFPAAFERVVAWAGEGGGTGNRQSAESTPVTFTGPAWQERVLAFGDDGCLAGTLCLPLAPRPGAPAVLIVSSGRNPRAGWGRSSVALARDLAAAGIVSLRYDARGFGDSAELTGKSEPLYSTAAVEDARQALDLLDTFGQGRLVTVGACSGAWTAFHAGLADRRVVGLVAINLQRFIWRPGDSLTVAMRQSVKPASFYRANLFRAAVWKRLMRGEIDLAAIVGGLVRRKLVLPLAKVGLGLASRLGFDTPATRVRGWIAGLGERGAAVLFINSEGDPALDEQAHYFGAPPAWLRRQPHVHESLIAEADHDLTQQRARAQADAAIKAFLEALGAPAGAERSGVSTPH